MGRSSVADLANVFDRQQSGSRRQSTLFEQPPQDEHVQNAYRQMVSERATAYREDLAAWLTTIFKEDITEETFFNEIQTGVKLCQLAKIIQEGERDPHKRANKFASKHSKRKHDPLPAPTNITYSAKPGTFQARDNITQFIEWCKSMGVDDSVIFEADDIVDGKRARNVLYSLMELARVQGGVEPPLLVQLERNLSMPHDSRSKEKEEAFIAGIRDTLRAAGLDPFVRIERRDDGRYKIGDFDPIAITQLRDHMMVRIGPNWDMLQQYFYNLKNKGAAPSSTPAKASPRLARVTLPEKSPLRHAGTSARPVPTPSSSFSRRSSSPSFLRSSPSTSPPKTPKAPATAASSSRGTQTEGDATPRRTSLAADQTDPALRRRLQEAENEAASLGDEKKKLTKELRELEFKVDSLQRAAQERDNQEAGKRVSLEDEIIGLKQQLKESQDKLAADKARNQREVTALQDRLAKKDDADHTGADEMAALRQQLQAAKDQAAAAEKAKASALNQLNGVENGQRSFEKQLEAALADKVKAERDGGAAKADLERARARADAAEEEMRALQASLANNSSDISNNEEMAQLRKALQDTQAALVVAEEERKGNESHLREKLKATEKRLQDTQNTVVKLDKELSEMDELSHEQEQETERKMDALQKRLRAAQDRQQEAEKELKDALQQHGHDASQKLAQARQAMQQAEDERDQAMRAARQHQEQAVAAESKLDLVQAELDQANTELGVLPNLRQELDDLRKRLNDEEAGHLQTKSNLNRIEGQLADANSSNARQRKQAETLIADLRDQVENLQDQMERLKRNQKDEANALDRQQLAEMQQREEEYKEAMEDLRRQLEKEKRQVQLVQDQANEELEAHTRRMREDMRAQKEEDDMRVAELQRKLDLDAAGQEREYKDKIASLERDISEAKEELKRVQDAANKELANAKRQAEADKTAAVAEAEKRIHDELLAKHLTPRLKELEDRLHVVQNTAEEDQKELLEKLRNSEQKNRELANQLATQSSKLPSDDSHADALRNNLEELVKSLQGKIEQRAKENEELQRQLDEKAGALATAEGQRSEDIAGMLKEAEERGRQRALLDMEGQSDPERIVLLERQLRDERLKAAEAEAKEAADRLAFKRELETKTADDIKQLSADLNKYQELAREAESKRMALKLQIESDYDKKLKEAQKKYRVTLAIFQAVEDPSVSLEELDVLDHEQYMHFLDQDEVRQAHEARLAARLATAEAETNATNNQNSGNQTDPAALRHLVDNDPQVKNTRAQLVTADQDLVEAVKKAIEQRRRGRKAKNSDASELQKRLAELQRQQAENAQEKARMEKKLREALDKIKLLEDQLDKVEPEAHQQTVNATLIQQLRDQNQGLEKQIEILTLQLAKASNPGPEGDDSLHAYRKDIADWLNTDTLELGARLSPDNLFAKLADGVIVCKLAEKIEKARQEAQQQQQAGGPQANGNGSVPHIEESFPLERLKQALTASPADRIQAFVDFCRTLGLEDPDVFDVDDLLQKSDEQKVIFGLFDVARQTYDMKLPRLVWWEHVQVPDIDISPAPLPSPLQSVPEKPAPRTTPVKGDEVDSAVWDIIREHGADLDIRRLSKGRYLYGPTNKLMLVRITNEQVMVRVGGGWEPLKSFLAKARNKSLQGPNMEEFRSPDPQLVRLQRGRSSKRSNSSSSSPGEQRLIRTPARRSNSTPSRSGRRSSSGYH
eukprot:m.98504 g.98504  ORF g.98504 m.98504 type:complete len:1703 (+) comp22106_c0_seq1:27-5135(+)